MFKRFLCVLGVIFAYRVAVIPWPFYLTKLGYIYFINCIVLRSKILVLEDTRSDNINVSQVEYVICIVHNIHSAVLDNITNVITKNMTIEKSLKFLQLLWSNYWNWNNLELLVPVWSLPLTWYAYKFIGFIFFCSFRDRLLFNLILHGLKVESTKQGVLREVELSCSFCPVIPIVLT